MRSKVTVIHPKYLVGLLKIMFIVTLRIKMSEKSGTSFEQKNFFFFSKFFRVSILFPSRYSEIVCAIARSTKNAFSILLPSRYSEKTCAIAREVGNRGCNLWVSRYSEIACAIARG